MLGDSAKTVQYWINRFEAKRSAGLVDADRLGRPPKLAEQHLDVINNALLESPADFGFSTNPWDGKTLSSYTENQYGIALGVRQCQRLFRQLGFRLRKPCPVIAKADPDRQAEYNKTLRNYD